VEFFLRGIFVHRDPLPNSVLLFNELCGISIELCLTGRRAEKVRLSRAMTLRGWRLWINLHAANWVVNLFQWNLPKLRNVVNALLDITLNQQGEPSRRIKSDAEPTERKHRMKDLASYLNDHLAGSVGALELLDRLIVTYRKKSLGRFFQDLRNEIDADQETLKDLIQALGEEESAVEKAGAWVAEKFSRMKIQLSDSPEEKVGLFLALEALALGITGKLSLWSALSVAAKNVPRLAQLDYTTLQKRAAEQRDLVEAERLEMAREVFR
jgi:hypothetical protein